ncbi:MAG TPA: DUF4880 domain-containing protein, partial [Puia sp.]|nr:DUF4880 domain-containing protein [Puia sp.]
MESNNQNELPWTLISAALQGELAPEDEARLRAWLAESPGNRDEFDRLERLWREGVADYPRYLAADETSAWNDMQARMGTSSAGSGGAAAPRIAWRQWLV